MTHSAMRSEFEQLIDVYAPVGQLGTGFTFTEGPIWHPRDHYLLFSDMPADVPDAVMSWVVTPTVSRVLAPTWKEMVPLVPP